MLPCLVPRQPAPFLACGAGQLRRHGGPNAFGNALGQSLGEALRPERQGIGPYSAAGYRNGSDIESDNATAERQRREALYSLSGGQRVRLNANDPSPAAVTPQDPPSDRRLLNDAEQAANPGAYTSVAGSGYKARLGDSISSILGTSDPQAIGNFMRANGLRSSTLRAGQDYFIPDDHRAYGDAAALGQAVLNQDNARLQALAEKQAAEQQAHWDSLRMGAWSLATGAQPVWHVGAGPIAGGVAGGVADATVEVPQYDALGNYTGTSVAVSATPPSMGYVESMGRLAEALHVPQGFVKNSYDQAIEGLNNTNNTWGERGVNLLAATAMLPLAFAEEMFRGVLNVPSSAAEAIPLASQAGVSIAAATDPRLDTPERIMAGLAATRDLAGAFVGLAGLESAIRPSLEIGPMPSVGNVGEAGSSISGAASVGRAPVTWGKTPQATEFLYVENRTSPLSIESALNQADELGAFKGNLVDYEVRPNGSVTVDHGGGLSINYHAVPDNAFDAIHGPNRMAAYKTPRDFASNELISWNDAFEDGVVNVHIRQSTLLSDRGTVAAFGHEYGELQIVYDGVGNGSYTLGKWGSFINGAHERVVPQVDSLIGSMIISGGR